MNPIKIALFIIFVFVLLFGLSIYSSQHQTLGQQQQGFDVLDYRIKYPTPDSFFNLERAVVKTDTVNQILANIEPLMTDTLSVATDSLPEKATLILDLALTDTTKIERLAYPINRREWLQKLKTKLATGSCRILHYGDSQIEGDRISSYLRNRFQKDYGGGGPGFMPIKQVYEQISAEISWSDQWLRYAIFDRLQEPLEHKKYGCWMSLSRFTTHEIPTDSLALDSLPIVSANINVGLSKKTYRRLRQYKEIGLHYGNAVRPTAIDVYLNGNIFQQDTLKADGRYHVYKIRLPKAPEDLKIVVEGKISPDFYGLTLDAPGGLQLDNVAMRGASGNLFTRLSRSHFKVMAAELDPQLVLLQFGGNTLPYLADSLEVRQYANSMGRQINWLKQSLGQAQFIFVGPTDMATMVNGQMQTYPLLPYLDEILQEKCLETGAAYWSMFRAMGGENSMTVWVEKKLAGSDFTHFSHKGSRFISELFYTALFLDLNETKPEDSL